MGRVGTEDRDPLSQERPPAQEDLFPGRRHHRLVQQRRARVSGPVHAERGNHYRAAAQGRLRPAGTDQGDAGPHPGEEGAGLGGEGRGDPPAEGGRDDLLPVPLDRLRFPVLGKRATARRPGADLDQGRRRPDGGAQALRHIQDDPPVPAAQRRRAEEERQTPASRNRLKDIPQENLRHGGQPAHAGGHRRCGWSPGGRR